MVVSLVVAMLLLLLLLLCGQMANGNSHGLGDMFLPGRLWPGILVALYMTLYCT